jgi:hypothetical protein
MLATVTPQTEPGHLHQAAGPLAAVLRALGEAPEGLAVTPDLASAALIFMAELITARCESCECASSPGDICPGCERLSAQAAGFRILAGEVS